MGTYSFTVEIAAPRDEVYALWINLDRAHEWIEGMAGITDLSGPPDQVGTTYVVKFGSWAKSPTRVIEADPPRLLTVAFGTWLLRGTQSARFEENGLGTRLSQTFRTNGVIPAIAGRIFATGSYKGSFRGELNRFKEICEREAQSRATGAT